MLVYHYLTEAPKNDNEEHNMTIIIFLSYLC